MNSENIRERKMGALILAKEISTGKATKNFIEKALGDHDNDRLRTACMDALRKAGKKALDYLPLESQEAEVRRLCIEIAKDLGADEKIFLKALHDQDSNVKIAALEALGKTNLYEVIFDILKKGEFPDGTPLEDDAKFTAAWALKEMAERGIGDPKKITLFDIPEDMLEEIALAFTEHKIAVDIRTENPALKFRLAVLKSDTKTYTELLPHVSQNDVKWALDTLGEIGITLAREIMKIHKDWVKDFVLKHPTKFLDIIFDFGEKHEIIAALRESRYKDLATYLACLSDPNPKCRAEATLALALFSTEEVLELLRTAILDEEEDIRLACVKVAGELGCEEILKKALDDRSPLVRKLAERWMK